MPRLPLAHPRTWLSVDSYFSETLKSCKEASLPQENGTHSLPSTIWMTVGLREQPVPEMEARAVLAHIATAIPGLDEGGRFRNAPSSSPGLCGGNTGKGEWEGTAKEMGSKSDILEGCLRTCLREGTRLGQANVCGIRSKDLAVRRNCQTGKGMGTAGAMSLSTPEGHWIMLQLEELIEGEGAGLMLEDGALWGRAEGNRVWILYRAESWGPVVKFRWDCPHQLCSWFPLNYLHWCKYRQSSCS